MKYSKVHGIKAGGESDTCSSSSNKIYDKNDMGHFSLPLISNKKVYLKKLKVNNNFLSYPGGGEGAGHLAIFKLFLKAFYECVQSTEVLNSLFVNC